MKVYSKNMLHTLKYNYCTKCPQNEPHEYIYNNVLRCATLGHLEYTLSAIMFELNQTSLTELLTKLQLLFIDSNITYIDLELPNNIKPSYKLGNIYICWR